MPGWCHEALLIGSGLLSDEDLPCGNQSSDSWLRLAVICGTNPGGESPHRKLLLGYPGPIAGREIPAHPGRLTGFWQTQPRL